MPAVASRKSLGQLLLDAGVLKPEQLQRALDEQRQHGNTKLLGEILVELRLCTPEQVAEALAASYGVPFACRTETGRPEGRAAAFAGIHRSKPGVAVVPR
ncbi:MAG: hypothetical protein QM770_03710 [Tepidisphaeraceae bacterium]